MKSKLSPSLSVGILGTGQLALMLADALRRLGIVPIIFGKDPHAPATRGNARFFQGDDQNVEDLKKFFSKVQIVAFENEFVNCRKLKEAALGSDVVFYPGLDSIELLQDKLNQKKLLLSSSLPTSAHFEIYPAQDVSAQILSVINQWDHRGILKWARMGYDGKGVFFANSSNLEEAVEFCQKAYQLDIPVYLEKQISFKRELAVIGVRSRHGQFISYPVVVSEQKNGICHRVYGPASHFGLSLEKEKEIQNYAGKIAEASKLVGSFGVEFFESQDGEILINEIAPRVHNSGHYTQNGSPTDQFENHWRALLGLSLGETKSEKCFAMLNILGPEEEVCKKLTDKMPLPTPRTHLHWYGKNGIKPGRKLGHLNGTVKNFSEIESLFKELDQILESWKE